jgi:hypothetical protein
MVKRFESDFAGNPGKMVNTIAQMYPIGNAVVRDRRYGCWDLEGSDRDHLCS